MPPRVSTIVVLQGTEPPHRFILSRADFPDMDQRYLWCGKALGWRPWDNITELVAKTFRTEDKAKQAAAKYATFPLMEKG